MPIDELTYPQPVANRQGPPVGVSGSGGLLADRTPPRTRIFPFNLGAAANTRSSVSTPLLKGPAVVVGVHMSKTGAAGGSRGFGLGKNPSPVTESNVAVAVALPFTPLFEGLDSAGGATGSPNETDMIVDSATPMLMDDSDLKLVILDAEFHLVVYNAAQGATAGQINGHVTVLEQVSLDALRNFL